MEKYKKPELEENALHSPWLKICWEDSYKSNITMANEIKKMLWYPIYTDSWL